MDGMGTQKDTIMLAYTNRVDVLYKIGCNAQYGDAERHYLGINQ